MRKLLYASAALALIGATAAHAGDGSRRTAGAFTGAAAGAATGAVVGGPIGAAAGGVVGAVIGADATVPSDDRTYVVEHPVDSVRIDGRLSEGYVIPDSVVIHEIPDNRHLGYVYVDGRPVIVRMHSRKVIYAARVDDRDGTTTTVETRRVDRHPAVDDDDSAMDGQGAYDDDDTTAAIPSDGPPDRVITYVERHRVAPVEIHGDIRRGYVVPESVELTPVPDDPDYAYVYLDDNGPYSGPVLVRRDTRRVIWVH